MIDGCRAPLADNRPPSSSRLADNLEQTVFVVQQSQNHLLFVSQFSRLQELKTSIELSSFLFEV